MVQGLPQLPLPSFTSSGRRAIELLATLWLCCNPWTAPIPDLGTICPNSVKSQYFKLLSQLPLMSPHPSGENATKETRYLCPFNHSTNSPLDMSQIRTMPLNEPVMMKWPLGEMATDTTHLPVILGSINSTLPSPVSIFHICVLLLCELETTRFPSHEKSNDSMSPVMLSKCLQIMWCPMSHI